MENQTMFMTEENFTKEKFDIVTCLYESQLFICGKEYIAPEKGSIRRKLKLYLKHWIAHAG